MRFGQLPSVREMTPDITPLLQARQMKDQAFQGIVNFVNKAAVDKVQKEKDAASLERATSLLTQVQAAYPNNAAIQGLNMETLGKEFMAKDGVGIINMLAQADLTRTATAQQALANAERAKTAKLQAERTMIETAAKKREIITGLREKRIEDDSESVLNEALNIYTSQTENVKKGVKPPNRRQAFSKIVQELISKKPADERSFIDKEGVIMSAMDRSLSIEEQELSLSAKNEDLKRTKLLNDVTDLDIAAANAETDRFAKESIDNFRLTARKTDTLLSQQRNIIELSIKIKEKINEFKNEKIADGKDEADIAKELSSALLKIVPGSIPDSINSLATQLASQIGSGNLLEMRAASVDGSSGYGQLTGIELQTLQSLYGILGTIKDNTFVASSLQVLEGSLESIQTAFFKKSKNIQYDFQQKFPVQYQDLDKDFYEALTGSVSEVN
jgi:hypothetical protein